MLFEKTPTGWNTIGTFAAVILGFAIPVSTALTTACVITITLAWWLGPQGKQKQTLLLSHPLTKWVALMVLLALFGLTYSIADPKALHDGMRDSLRLALIPMLLYFYKPRAIARWTLWAFVGAMVLTLLLAYMKVYGNVGIETRHTCTAAIFKDHIKTGFLMAIAACFLAQQAKNHNNNLVRGICALFAVAMVHYLVFMNTGRIGYGALVIGLSLLLWQWYRLKGLLSACVISVLLIGIAYMTSDLFSQRIDRLSQEWNQYQYTSTTASPDSSLGARLDFAKTSIALIAEHPWRGWGTGSFGQAYAQQAADQALLTDNPHNEFLRMGTEYGVTGILLLLLFFYRQVRLSTQLPHEQKNAFRNLLCIFIFGCLANSWLKDSTEGTFYCMMSAALFASYPLTQKQKQQQKKVMLQ